MPRHAFRFPHEVIEAVKWHVRNAIDAVEPKRFRQEATYTAALVNRLEGKVYEGVYGSVVFKSTVFDDRGANSAESRLGADHAITATISDGISTVQKAILVQAKLGMLDTLASREIDFLKGQIRKMKHFVGAPKIMEIVELSGKRFPRIISGNNLLNGRPSRPIDLPNYFTARVTTTLDGCTNPYVVSIVQDSSLNQLHVIAKLDRKRLLNDVTIVPDKTHTP